jgi:hypothetical protein
VLAFAEARKYSCGDIGQKNIAFRRSQDGGHSWSPTRFIYNDTLPSSATRGLNMGAATYDATTKEVFVHFGECVHLQGCNASVLFIKSSDGGDTFSAGSDPSWRFSSYLLSVCHHFPCSCSDPQYRPSASGDRVQGGRGRRNPATLQPFACLWPV